MILVDEVVGWNDAEVVSALSIKRSDIFAREKGLPAHVALEWMAQTCGLLVGIRALEAARAVRVGFLLGTRDFEARQSWFNFDDRIMVTAKTNFEDDEMAVFDCRVERSSAICATARLTLYQPADLEAMLESQGIRRVGR
jgi:predicted hotdog family 3-hydroxylacyl-ACP dehydratase